MFAHEGSIPNDELDPLTGGSLSDRSVRLRALRNGGLRHPYDWMMVMTFPPNVSGARGAHRLWGGWSGRRPDNAPAT